MADRNRRDGTLVSGVHMVASHERSVWVPAVLGGPLDYDGGPMTDTGVMLSAFAFAVLCGAIWEWVL